MPSEPSEEEHECPKNVPFLSKTGWALATHEMVLFLGLQMTFDNDPPRLPLTWAQCELRRLTDHSLLNRVGTYGSRM